MGTREESDITQGPVFLLKESKDGDHYTLLKHQEVHTMILKVSCQ